MEDFNHGEMREVALHDGSTIMLKKVDKEYDPTNRKEALNILADAIKNRWLITGLIYVDPDAANMLDMYDLPETPLNRLPVEKIRPSKETLEELNQKFI